MKILIVITALCGLAMATSAEVEDSSLPPVQSPESSLFWDVDENGKLKVINENDEATFSDCHDVKNAGYNTNGTYRISVNGTKVLAPCMFANGFVYLIILARIDGAVNFNRGIRAYEKPFGEILGNYWYGLANIHHMTTYGHNHVLDIHTWDWTDLRSQATYSYFSVDSAATGWRLRVSGFRSGASHRLSDAMAHNNRMQFYTFDRPDRYGCAKTMHGGWWYNKCTASLPTGQYYVGGYYKKRGPSYDGIFWSNYFKSNPFGYSMKRLFLTIRRPL